MKEKNNNNINDLQYLVILMTKMSIESTIEMANEYLYGQEISFEKTIKKITESLNDKIDVLSLYERPERAKEVIENILNKYKPPTKKGKK